MLKKSFDKYLFVVLEMEAGTPLNTSMPSTKHISKKMKTSRGDPKRVKLERQFAVDEETLVDFPKIISSRSSSSSTSSAGLPAGTTGKMSFGDIVNNNFMFLLKMYIYILLKRIL